MKTCQPKTSLSFGLKGKLDDILPLVCDGNADFRISIVYRKGDIVMEPMNSRDVLPKNVPGVGWGGGGVSHVGVGLGGVGWGGWGWGGLCRGGVGWVM